MGKTIKTNKQIEREASEGKIAYRKRVIQETEAEEAVADFLWFQRDLFEDNNKNKELDDSTEI